MSGKSNMSKRYTAEFKRDAIALTTDEREELRRVRRELAEVKKANEILVKAAAFFAKEIVK
ncbi:hypothetical protein [Streptomyces adustus]